MKQPPGDSDPLHEYETDAIPANPLRQRKLLLLRQAIQMGVYNEGEMLDRLIHNLHAGLSSLSDEDHDCP